MISGVSKVVIGVDDQERAKAFWTQTMGFEVVQDVPYGSERWLELRAPEDTVNVVLDLRPAVSEAGAVPDELPTSNVMFSCDDLRATHAKLVARGVLFAQEPVHQPFGWWSMFEDGEGNRFALEQAGKESS